MMNYERGSVTELPLLDGDGTRITYSTFSGINKSWNISENYIQRDKGM